MRNLTLTTEEGGALHTRRRSPRDEPTPRPERFFTNRTFTDALKNGTGPLTLVQRIGLFLFGATCMAGSIVSLAISFIMPARMRQNTTSDAAYYLSAFMMVLIAMLVGCGALALGLRTLRHVIWRAGRTER